MDTDQEMSSKVMLRKQMMKARKMLDPVVKKAMDDAIVERLYALDVMHQAQSVFVFLSSPEEVTTDRIVQEALSRKQVVCAPRVMPSRHERIMHAYALTSLQDVTYGAFGIREPIIQNSPVDPLTIDVVVVPGLAFTAQGARLGYGGGYYDRYLKNVLPTTSLLGVAYDLQMVSYLPVFPHDYYMHAVITPTHIYHIK